MEKANINLLIGKKFNRWTIIKEAEPIKYKKGFARRVLCRCICGTEKITDLSSIKNGKSTSCGCYNIESATKRATKHGLCMLSKGVRHPDYCIWEKLKGRCCNKQDKGYKNYGARGIKICDRWLHSFENFITDLGWRPEPRQDYSLERIENNKDYCPENCKWILKSEQSKNTRRVKRIQYEGEEYCLTHLCKKLALNYSVMRHRVCDLNIPFEEAIKHPKYKNMTSYKIEKMSSEEKINTKRIFTENEITNLQHDVYKIVGDGEVMKLFNKLLEINAA